MARRWAVFCCCVMLMASGCRSAGGGDTVSEPVTTDFSCEADIRYRDMELKGTLSRSAAGTLALTFAKPDTLKGVTVQWDGEAVKASLYGLSFDLSPDVLPAGAVGNLMTDALDAVLRAPTTGTATENGVRWEGTGQNGDIALLWDPTDGSLLSLDIPTVPLAATFDGFQSTVT